MASVSNQQLLSPLEKPPQAFSLTVRKILGKVEAAEIRVPDFQRPLRWKASDVVKLFDSVLKGYPIGSLLFWKKDAPADESFRIGNARHPVPKKDGAWFIVDGQQRTTALAAALLDLDHRGDNRWIVRYDPIEMQFLSGEPSGDEKGRHVPLRTLGDLKRLGRWLRDCELDVAMQTQVEDVQQRILDFEVPAYLMDTDDPEGLKGAFARLNSTGVRMRPDEVFQALLGTRAHTAGKLDLQRLQESCDLDGFGQPPRPEVLKAVLAMSGLDPSRRLEDLGEKAVSHLVGEFDATEALQATVAFLQTPSDSDDSGAGIPSYGFIPYPIAFVLLARWFYLFPETDKLTRRELSKWLWRGVVTGVHQRAAVSKMRLQSRSIVEDDFEGSLKRLLDSVNEPLHVDWTLQPFFSRNAASRVELLTLLALEPSDRRGKVSWKALVSDGERVAREIFRSKAWEGLELESKQAARTAANRALLDARHTGLSSEFKTWSFEHDRAALESHLIDKISFEHLIRNDVAQFLIHRGNRVRTAVSKFLSVKAGIGEPRLRPVDTYLDHADSPESD
ncbi:MAG: DUF262 domain-containing protein [Myxococcales bacterium]|nr:DUF262 domain-containing protein [Myxococcales bacterium]